MPRQTPEQVHSISPLPRSRAEEQGHRMRNYTISMTIRTLCFLMAGLFVTAVPWQAGAWICLVAAAILPYPAVVMANARDMRAEPAPHEPVIHRMLHPGSTHRTHTSADTGAGAPSATAAASATTSAAPAAATTVVAPVVIPGEAVRADPGSSQSPGSPSL